MAISSQSQSVLARLDEGERVASGRESVGPLDAPTRLLLRLLVEQGELLNHDSGAEQARKLRELYVDANRASERQAEDATEEGGTESDGAPADNGGVSESSGEAPAVTTGPMEAPQLDLPRSSRCRSVGRTSWFSVQRSVNTNLRPKWERQEQLAGRNYVGSDRTDYH